MKLNKDEMRKILGGGDFVFECETQCPDGTWVFLKCPEPMCHIYPGYTVRCGNTVTRICTQS